MTSEPGQSGDPEFADPGQKLALVVDDDESQRDLLSQIVKNEGFRLETAGDGAAALRKVQSTPPDIILLDLILPGLGGYEMLRELQAQGLGSIPVIVLTARVMDRKAFDAIKQEPNVRDLQTKPVRMQALAAAMHSILRTRPARVRRGKDHWGA